jgi:endonuclease/exonuclease/phosphatase family metal-dependent hydrolase
MTYNILDGGQSFEGRLGAVVQIVKSLAPDILCLNECNRFDEEGERTMFRLEKDLDMRGFFLRARTGYHTCLFVRDLAVLEVHRMSDAFHHGALRVRLLHGAELLHVIAAHLCPFSGEDRLREAQHLAGQAREPWVILMGDLNSISARDVERVDFEQMTPHRRSRHFLPGTTAVDTRAIAAIETAGFIDLYRRSNPAAAGNTVPTPLGGAKAGPEVRFDYIFGTAKVAEALVRCDVIESGATRAASDHFPLVADLSL